MRHSQKNADYQSEMMWINVCHGKVRICTSGQHIYGGTQRLGEGTHRARLLPSGRTGRLGCPATVWQIQQRRKERRTTRVKQQGPRPKAKARSNAKPLGMSSGGAGQGAWGGAPSISEQCHQQLAPTESGSTGHCCTYPHDRQLRSIPTTA